MKTQIVLPDTLGEKLKQLIPVRQRSSFIAEALEKQLRILKFKKALKATAGAWTTKNHPDLRTQADINHYIAQVRGCHHGLRRHVKVSH